MPFPQEADLAAKEKRLNALNALLAVESRKPRDGQEHAESAQESALRPAEKTEKPCVHALLSELVKKAAEAPRSTHDKPVREPAR